MGVVIALDRLLLARDRLIEPVVLANGCFDLFHLGHFKLLRAAKKEGKTLIVGLNSDRSVKASKGPDRPIYPEHDRAELIAAFNFVDFVFVFDEESILPSILKLRPTVLVKGYEYAMEKVVGSDFVLSHGGKVVRFPMVGTISTTSLIKGGICSVKQGDARGKV